MKQLLGQCDLSKHSPFRAISQRRQVKYGWLYELTRIVRFEICCDQGVAYC
jgi:hypothetical protein